MSYTPIFNEGDIIKMGKSASIPEAEVLGILEISDGVVYKLKWSNGNINVKSAEDIDKKAINTPTRL